MQLGILEARAHSCSTEAYGHFNVFRVTSSIVLGLFLCCFKAHKAVIESEEEKHRVTILLLIAICY